jgi:hypothetical protein
MHKTETEGAGKVVFEVLSAPRSLKKWKRFRWGFINATSEVFSRLQV